MQLFTPKTILFVLFTFAILWGCSNNPQDKRFNGVQMNLYDEGQRVLGFEDHNDWSNTNSNSVVHTQGQNSIEVYPQSWTEVQSIPLSSLGIVLDEITVDVFLPEMPSWGTISVIVRVPSRNLYYRQLDVIQMNTLTVGQFKTVSFIMPSDVATALNGTYEDLTLTVVLNAPEMSNPILLDNLRVVELQDELPDTDVPVVEALGNSRDFVFALPATVNLNEAFMTANQSIRLSNGVTVTNDNAVVSNMGIGKLDVYTDVSLGGDVYAMGDVALADRVSIDGFVRANGTCEEGNDVYVAGGVEDIEVSPGKLIAWTTIWPEATRSFFIDNTQIENPPPGSYESIEVQPGGTLQLSPGNYYVNSIVVQSEGKVEINSSGSPVVLYVKDVLVARGEFLYNTSSEDFLVAYGGTYKADLDAPFGGTVVAPNAEVRLAPLNGKTHEGSFVGKSINAEAHNVIDLKPFAHWDYLLGMDACTPVNSYFDCSAIAAWEQKEYESGDKVTDGERVYKVRDGDSVSLAGSASEYAPGVGTSWLEAWSVAGVCNSESASGEYLNNISVENVVSFFSFDRLVENNTSTIVPGVKGQDAAVVGADIYLRNNSRRTGCTVESSIMLNSYWYPEWDGMTSSTGEKTYLEFDKTLDTNELSVLMQLKAVSEDSQTFLSFANESETKFAIGYSEQNGFYVQLGGSGTLHYSGKDGLGDIVPGEWMDLGVVIENISSTTSKIQLNINGESLFMDGDEDGIVVDGILDLTDGKWVIGGYQDAILGSIHSQFVGEIGALLLLDAPVPAAMTADFTDFISQMSSVTDDTSSFGKEAQLNTKAPDIHIPNPLDGYKELPAPEINTEGTASFVYPFEIPQAIVGPTPTLGLQYSSDNNGGNAGIGWNFSVSRIEFDTSEKGVPEYHGPSGEYTNLVFDGDKLVFWKQDGLDYLYRAKKEKEFYTVRYTSDNYMKVEYPDGSYRLYGNVPGSPLRRLDSPENIFKWYLGRTTDANGNSVHYTYGSANVSGAIVEPYPTQIDYGNNGRYVIDFEWSEKDDYRISGRGGFLVADRMRLDNISVRKSNGDALKSFTLEYEDAALFGKRLREIVEYSHSGGLIGEELSRFEFEYTELGFDYTDSYSGQEVEQEYAYFKPADSKYAYSLNQSREESIFVDKQYSQGDPRYYSRAYVKKSILDWNGDGEPELVENFDASHLLDAQMRDDGEYWMDLVSEYDFDESDECRFPFELVAGEDIFEPGISQTLAEDGGEYFKNTALMDINGDGYVDLVQSCSDKLHVLFNQNGQLSSSPRTVYISPGFYQILDTVSYNYDYSDERSDLNYWMESNSLEAGWEDWIPQVVDRRNFTSIKMIDFDGDGDLDRLWAAPPGYGNGIFLQETRYTVPTPGYVPVGGYIENPFLEESNINDGQAYGDISFSTIYQRLMDINGDGLPDLVYGNSALLNIGLLSETPLTWQNFPATDVDEYLQTKEGDPPVADSTIGFSHLIFDQYTNEYGFIYGPEATSYAEQWEAQYKMVLKKDMIDMNGDGLLDSVAIHDDAIWVALNIGSRFLDEQQWVPLESHEPHFLTISWELIDYGVRITSTTTSESFLKDCNGDGVLDFIVPSVDYYSDRWCRINNTGKVNRLNKIFNPNTGRTIELIYDEGHHINNMSVSDNATKRTVLSNVRVGNSYAEDAPVDVFEYSYSNGVLDKRNRKFLGWESITSKKSIVGHVQDGPSFYDHKVFEFSSVEGLDHWGVNEVPDDYYNGTLLKHETYYQAHENDDNRYLSRFEYEYGDEPVLDSCPDARYVYPTNTYTSRFNQWGGCLYDPGITEGRCPNRELISTDISFDTEYGTLRQSTVRHFGDSRVDYDDITTFTEYERIDGTSITKPVSERKFHNDQVGQTTIITTEIAETLYSYYPDGNLQQKIEGAGDVVPMVTDYSYTSTGLLASETNNTGLPTLYEHSFFDDESGNMVYRLTTTTSDGTETEKLFDAYNRVKQVTINEGRTEYYEYDERGRLTGTGNHVAGGINVHYRYFSNVNNGDYIVFGVEVDAEQGKEGNNETINIFSLVDPTGKALHTKTRVMIENEPMWIVSGSKQYDEFGRLVKEGKNYTLNGAYPPSVYNDAIPIDPVIYEYDDLSRVVKITDSDGLYREFEYSTCVHAYWKPELEQTLYYKKVNDQDGNVRKQVSDIYGNVVAERQESPGGDALETLTIIHGPLELEMVSPLGHSHRYYRDSLGRLSKSITPDAGEVVYIYNNIGKVSNRLRLGKDTAGEAQETKYYYDEHGRIEAVDNDGIERDVAYSYCPDSADAWNKNRICEIAVGMDPSSVEQTSGLVTEFTYYKFSLKKRRKLVRQNDDGGISISDMLMMYELDAYGRTKGVVYPDFEVVEYWYDEAGRLKSITGDVPYISDIQYDVNNRRQLVTNGDGTVREYEYTESSDQLSQMTVFSSDSMSNRMLDLNYDYNDRRLLSVVENRESDVSNHFDVYFGYDSFGRIDDAYGASNVGVWRLDNQYTFDGDTRLVQSSVSGIVRETDFLSGTSAPEVISAVDGDGVEIETKYFSYNNFGELLGVDTAVDGTIANSRQFTFNSDGTLGSIVTPGVEAEFKYDSFGNRISKRVSHINGIVNETLYMFNLYSEKDDIASNHISDGKYVVATKLNNDENNVLYFTPDHLGSTVMVTNATGAILSKSMYDPFGNTIFNNSLSNDTEEYERKFTNQIYDEETGLYYYNARYYDPENGVFISPDPAMDGLNHYAYARGNPLLYTDPTGLAVNFEGNYQLNSLDMALMSTDFLGLGIFPKAGALIAAKLAARTGVTMAKVALSKGGGLLLRGLSTATVSLGQQVGKLTMGLRNTVVSGLPKVTETVAKGASALPRALQGGEAAAHVYFGVRNGKQVYVGITNNLARRQAEHGSRFVLERVTQLRVTRGEARAIEQAIINHNPGFENIRNSISPNHSWYEEAVEWGEAWLNAAGYLP